MKQTQIFLLLAVLGSTLTAFGQSTSAACRERVSSRTRRALANHSDIDILSVQSSVVPPIAPDNHSSDSG